MADDARPASTLIPRRFSRAEFDTMVGSGLFREGEKVELIEGVVASMMGEGFPHADAVDFLADALTLVCPVGLKVRVRTRLDIGDDSEVYPDILVEVAGTKAADRSPASVHLLVEVSDTTLAADRNVKAARYASEGFREYWVLDLNARKLWVHRDPADETWMDLSCVGEEGAAPLFAPGSEVSLASILTTG
ncbi:MAG: Uma2 family endonuclease [Alphaproteobacteria bacterium]|nr:Uma2 family endonuclease [Alphaproteobacteria bacterium]